MVRSETATLGGCDDCLTISGDAWVGETPAAWMTPETSPREAACISEEGTVPQTFTHLKLPIRRDTWEVVIRDSKTLTSKIMKTAGLHSLIRRTILPVSTVELNRRCGSLVNGLRLILGSTQKAFATGTNLTPQPATESLFRGKRGGRPTGLEPATARTTIWSSTIELRPPWSSPSAKAE